MEMCAAASALSSESGRQLAMRAIAAWLIPLRAPAVWRMARET
eukprot:SAG25_NODE_387_length_8678_cov_163.615573_2_plen_43_part_00